MRDCSEKRTYFAFGAILALVAAESRAQDRGTLQVRTSPDSAIVVLDDAKDPEHQRTPYLNESMIQGAHSILLRPADPAYMSARYTIGIDAGQTSVVEHVFEYRTKATGMELLSVAPWKLGLEYGILFQRYIGFQSSSPPAPPALPTPSTYPSDSIPSSLSLPFQVRLGFPGGIETHVSIPLAEKSLPQAPGSLALGDVGLGVKWTYAPLNSAIDMSYVLGSAKQQNLGQLSDALTFTLITSQRYQSFDLAGNLGYSLRFNSMSADSGSITPGDAAFLRLRAGMLFFDQILPLVQASLDYRFATTRGSATVRDPSILATVSPGVVWYAGQNWAFEIGVPLGLYASNEETRWGLQGSFAWGFGLASKSAHPTVAKSAPVSSYPLQAVGVPLNAPLHVLFSGHEVTNGEYKEFCEKTGHESPADPEFASLPGYFSDPRLSSYPVVNISIADARAYAAWVGKRLPTVGEWRREVENISLSGAQVACGLEAPEPATSRPQGAGVYNLIGNVAEWVENDRGSGSVAYMAGGFFSLPRERCLDKGRWVDVASPAGAKYIGFRTVTEVK